MLSSGFGNRGGAPRGVSLALAALVGLLVSPAAWAAPWDRFSDDRQSCVGGECTVCGVPWKHDGYTITWGALQGSALEGAESSDNPLISAGIALYCANSGGVVLTTASSSGVQMQTLSSTFRTLQRRPGAPRPTSVGGVFEVNHLGSTAGDFYGTAIPISHTFVLSPLSDIEAAGNVIIGGGNGIYQYGFNLNPVYTRFLLGHEDEDSWRLVVGGALPLQFVGTSGSDIDFGAAWAVGAGGMVGISHQLGSGAIGAGATLDLSYAGGFTAPFLLAVRSAQDLSRLSRFLQNLVIQPGLSFDFAASSNIEDTMRVSLLVGLESGSWVMGYQTSFIGGSSAHAFGVTYVGRAGQLAAGSGAYQRQTEESTPAPASTPSPAPSPAPAPASTPAPVPAPATAPAAPVPPPPASKPATDEPAASPAAPQPAVPASPSPAAPAPSPSHP